MLGKREDGEPFFALFSDSALYNAFVQSASLTQFCQENNFTLSNRAFFGRIHQDTKTAFSHMAEAEKIWEVILKDHLDYIKGDISKEKMAMSLRTMIEKVYISLSGYKAMMAKVIKTLTGGNSPIKENKEPTFLKDIRQVIDNIDPVLKKLQLLNQSLTNQQDEILNRFFANTPTAIQLRENFYEDFKYLIATPFPKQISAPSNEVPPSPENNILLPSRSGTPEPDTKDKQSTPGTLTPEKKLARTTTLLRDNSFFVNGFGRKDFFRINGLIKQHLVLPPLVRMQIGQQYKPCIENKTYDKLYQLFFQAAGVASGKSGENQFEVILLLSAEMVTSTPFLSVVNHSADKALDALTHLILKSRELAKNDIIYEKSWRKFLAILAYKHPGLTEKLIRKLVEQNSPIVRNPAKLATLMPFIEEREKTSSLRKERQGTWSKQHTKTTAEFMAVSSLPSRKREKMPAMANPSAEQCKKLLDTAQFNRSTQKELIRILLKAPENITDKHLLLFDFDLLCLMLYRSVRKEKNPFEKIGQQFGHITNTILKDNLTKGIGVIQKLLDPNITTLRPQNQKKDGEFFYFAMLFTQTTESRRVSESARQICWQHVSSELVSPNSKGSFFLTILENPDTMLPEAVTFIKQLDPRSRLHILTTLDSYRLILARVLRNETNSEIEEVITRFSQQKSARLSGLEDLDTHLVKLRDSLLLPQYDIDDRIAQSIKTSLIRTLSPILSDKVKQEALLTKLDSITSDEGDRKRIRKTLREIRLLHTIREFIKIASDPSATCTVIPGEETVEYRICTAKTAKKPTMELGIGKSSHGATTGVYFFRINQETFVLKASEDAPSEWFATRFLDTVSGVDTPVTILSYPASGLDVKQLVAALTGHTHKMNLPPIVLSGPISSFQGIKPAEKEAIKQVLIKTGIINDKWHLIITHSSAIPGNLKNLLYEELKRTSTMLHEQTGEYFAILTLSLLQNSVNRYFLSSLITWLKENPVLLMEFIPGTLLSELDTTQKIEAPAMKKMLASFARLIVGDIILANNDRIMVQNFDNLMVLHDFTLVAIDQEIDNEKVTITLQSDTAGTEEWHRHYMELIQSSKIEETAGTYCQMLIDQTQRRNATPEEIKFFTDCLKKEVRHMMSASPEHLAHLRQMTTSSGIFSIRSSFEVERETMTAKLDVVKTRLNLIKKPVEDSSSFEESTGSFERSDELSE